MLVWSDFSDLVERFVILLKQGEEIIHLAVNLLRLKFKLNEFFTINFQIHSVYVCFLFNFLPAATVEAVEMVYTHQSVAKRKGKLLTL